MTDDPTAPRPRRRVILALPAYNESENLPSLVATADRVFRDAEYDFHILVVNDGSTDNTAQVLKELAEKYPLTPIEHERNSGLGAAIRTSIKESLKLTRRDDDIIVNMDADDTHDPSYVPGMTARIWHEGYDVVIASRYRDGSKEVGVPLFRRMLSRGARILFQLTLRLPDVRDYTCGFRAYRASLLRDAMAKYGDDIITRQGFACTDELLMKLSTLTKRMTEVPFVLRYDKKRGGSKLQLGKTIIETFKMLLSHK